MSSKTGYAQQLTQHIEKTNTHKNTYKPLLFNLVDPVQKYAFEELLQEKENLQVYDHIHTQVQELIKCLHPTIVFLPPSELEKAVVNHFGKTDPQEYGVWVYYPWANKLVHLLNEEEFSIVRTNRNKHKITVKEQQTLSNKKIGIIGLSVGQSVSLTLAMERGFGELRIADFDELDLSNINRIRTGVFNIKLKKTVIVAREIAEIDPFLNVICYEEGITAHNLDDFLTKNGNLDLLIDECDSFDIKINARTKAKALGIPVLMEGSDRGTIDIERFDLEPERPVLHGMVDHLDMSKYPSLTTMDERIPYITAVTGVETLSPRMKASAVEIMATISTWPQLASAVTYGGGITADLARKILLGNLNTSGRFFIDIDELIQDPSIVNPITLQKQIKPITTADIQNFIAAHPITPNEDNIDLPESILQDLVMAASKAPSGGNNQPWRWHYQDNLLHLFLDQNAAQAYLDPQLISSYTSIGTAIENLLVKAAAHNLDVNWQLTPQLAPNHLAWFSFKEDKNNVNEAIKLAKQIDLRHTNRKISQKEDIDSSSLQKLKALAEEIEGAKLTWVTNPESIKALAGITIHTDLLRMFVDEAHSDFIHREMRWDLDEVYETQDGIGIHTLDLSNNDQVGIRLIKDKRAVDFLQKIDGGSGFKRLTMQQFNATSAIGLISMPNHSAKDFILGGRAAEKIWLEATSLNLQIHPINVPLIFFYKNSIEKNLNIPEKDKAILTHLENNFKQIFALASEEQAIFMFRIFKATPSPERTIRKSLAKIFSIGRT